MAASAKQPRTVNILVRLKGGKYDWEQYSPQYPQWEFQDTYIEIPVPESMVEKRTDLEGKPLFVINRDGHAFVTRYMYELNKQAIATTIIPPTIKKG